MTSTAPSYPIAGLASPANLLTISRIIAAPALFLVILDAEATRGTSWLAFWMGVVFATTDYLDGTLARRSGSVSRSGAFLDPLADKIVVLGAALSFVAVDRLMLVPTIIIAVRELGVSGLRVYWAQRGLAMPARRSGKYKALFQGLILIAAAMPTLLDQQELIDVGWWAVTVFTVVTGIQYVLDGRAATSVEGQ